MCHGKLELVALSFEQARECVLREVRSLSGRTEEIQVLEAAGRVLAEGIAADRDYPPFDRSARDGYAVRAADLPGELRLIGEVRAGEVFTGTVGRGEAVEIMTGAPLPPEGYQWVHDAVKRDVHLGSSSGGTDLCTAFVGPSRS